MLHSSGYGDPKLPHLSVDLLHPWPPLSHSPCGDEPLPCHAHANRSTLFSQCGETRLQEKLPKLRGERVRFVDESPPEGCYAPSELLPSDVGMDDGLQVCESLTSLPGPDRALRELMTSKSTSEVYSSSGRHGGALPSSASVALANTAAGAVAETAAWSSEGHQCAPRLLVSR